MDYANRPTTGRAAGGKRWLSALAVAVALLPGVVAAQEDGIFFPADPPAGGNAPADAVSDSITLRRRLVTVDIDRLAEARAAVGGGGQAVELLFNLFDDAELGGIVESTSPTPSGYVLSGHIDGVEGSTLTVVVNGSVVAGTIRTAGGTWRIRSAGDGLHVVSQVDESRLPPGAEPLRPPTEDADFPLQPQDTPLKPAAVSKARARTAPGPGDLPRTVDPIDAPRNTESQIDVAVFYTPAARRAEGGTAGIEALIDLMVAETNRAYADSDVQQRLALVARGETAYTESGFPSLDLGRLAGTVPVARVPAVPPDDATPIEPSRGGSGSVQFDFSVTGAVTRLATAGRAPPRRQPKNALHSRGETMSADAFAAFCEDTGLALVTQELVNWGGRDLIDCISCLAPGAAMHSPLRRVRAT